MSGSLSTALALVLSSPNFGAGGPIARMTSSAGTCGARSCVVCVDWLNYKRISRRGSQGDFDGCLRITKIQGMATESFL